MARKAGTESPFFDCADMLDTSLGAADNKSDPADVVRDGWDALMAGQAHFISDWKNKSQATTAYVTPAPNFAEQHRKTAESGSAEAVLRQSAGLSRPMSCGLKRTC